MRAIRLSGSLRRREPAGAERREGLVDAGGEGVAVCALQYGREGVRDLAERPLVDAGQLPLREQVDDQRSRRASLRQSSPGAAARPEATSR